MDSFLVAEQLQVPHGNYVTHKRSPPLQWISFRSKHASFPEYPRECLLAPPPGFLNQPIQHGAGITLSSESGAEMTSLRCWTSCTGVVCGGKLGPLGKSEGEWQVGTHNHVPTPQRVNPRTHPLLALRQASVLHRRSGTVAEQRRQSSWPSPVHVSLPPRAQATWKQNQLLFLHVRNAWAWVRTGLHSPGEGNCSGTIQGWQTALCIHKGVYKTPKQIHSCI